MHTYLHNHEQMYATALMLLLISAKLWVYMRRARFVQGLGKRRLHGCQMQDRISRITQRCCASPDPLAINVLRYVSLCPGPKDLHVLLCPGTNTSRAGHRSCCLLGKRELPVASCLHWEHRRHLTQEEVWISCEFGVRISTLFHSLSVPVSQPQPWPAGLQLLPALEAAGRAVTTELSVAWQQRLQQCEETPHFLCIYWVCPLQTDAQSIWGNCSPSGMEHGL